MCIFDNMSRVVRKLAFCICDNKHTDQLRGNREADQCLYFRYTDTTIPKSKNIRNFKPLAIFCGCTARFMSDQVRNPEDRFSHNRAHIQRDNFAYFSIKTVVVSVHYIGFVEHRYLSWESVRLLIAKSRFRSSLGAR